MKKNIIIIVIVALLSFVTFVSLTTSSEISSNDKASPSKKITINVRAAEGSDISINDKKIGKTPGNTCGAKSTRPVTVTVGKKITIKAYRDFGNSNPTGCGCKGTFPFYTGKKTITPKRSMDGTTVTVPQNCCAYPSGKWCMPI